MERKIRFTEHTVRRAMSGQVVLLQTKSSQYYIATGAGVEICTLIEHGASFDEIVRHISQTYDTDTSTATADTEEFLKSLASADMILRPSA